MDIPGYYSRVVIRETTSAWVLRPNRIDLNDPQTVGLHDPLRPEPRAIHEELVDPAPPTRLPNFWHLPYELRQEIWEMLLPPPRIICLMSPQMYEKYSHIYKSVHIPAFYPACEESKEIVQRWGVGLRFVSYKGMPIHCEWFNRRRDILYLPSIMSFGCFDGWGSCLDNSTIILNVLEVLEDRYRGDQLSKHFTQVVDQGRFDKVKAFRLSMLKVQWGGDQWDEELDIYGEDTMAVLDLDDPRLPTLLRPVFQNMRFLLGSQNKQQQVHKRPSCLLRHLRHEWEAELKFLFEEQWLQSYLQKMDKLVSEELYTGKRFGLDDQRRALDRGHELVRTLIAGMPSIRPVILFEKCYPSTVLSKHNPGAMAGGDDVWNGGRQWDGLRCIAHRRGMTLTYSRGMSSFE